jgi:hypothetical protein
LRYGYLINRDISIYVYEKLYTKSGGFFMKKLNFLMITVLVLAIGFSLASCKEDGGNSGKVSISGDIVGVWSSSYGGGVSCNVTTSTWELTGAISDSGYFTAWNNNTATLYSTYLKAVTGTATLISPTKATVELKSPAPYPGTYEFTKVATP